MSPVQSSIVLNRLAVPANGISGARTSLTPGQTLVIGRDPACDLAVPDSQGSVSRRHATVRMENGCWCILDMQSSQGVAVNGRRIPVNVPVPLNAGDRVQLGLADQTGIVFVIEAQNNAAPLGFSPAAPPVAGALGYSAKPNLSEFVPFVNTDTAKLRTQLLPGLLVAVITVYLFMLNSTLFKGDGFSVQGLFNYITAVGSIVVAMCSYFIYLSCGKKRAWQGLLCCGLVTYAILQTPLLGFFIKIFREILPGATENKSGIDYFIGMFFGAGLMEELIKAVPLFIGVYIYKNYSYDKDFCDVYGLREPLDGIILGVISGAVFTAVETCDQYAKGAFAKSYIPIYNALSTAGLPKELCQNFAGGVGGLKALCLTLPRTLAALSGHCAYAAYFGYFIGLGAMGRLKWPVAIAVGWGSASFLHASWNSVSEFVSKDNYAYGLTIAACVAYAFLAAAIIRARKVSPTRNSNFATIIKP